MNKWQYLPRNLWFLKWKALGASSPLADFGRLRTSSEDFGRLRKTSDFFGNLRKWSCRLQKSQHSQDKNLTLISQKKLAGIKFWSTGACCLTVSIGGLQFLLVWILFLVFWSIPVILIEYSVGRYTRHGPVKSFRSLVGPWSLWCGGWMVAVVVLIGWVSVSQIVGYFLSRSIWILVTAD